ncbi:xanthine dehydrogenase family protein subunit M [Streptosporangium fragile]|uniref:Xanthine dehydrogenase family protein subunit M n=1 Tax=Streptosporangium fragile TaxID=46186 RepID=A0ABP6IB41_9ACTN
MIGEFHRPGDLAGALEALADAGDEGKIIAGGTALVLMIEQGLVAPSVLISLDRVRDPMFSGVELVGRTIRIGGGETLAAVAAHPLVRQALPGLAEACRRVGNVRIRNRATLAGNLAESDYASDPPAALVAHRATCRVVSLDGERSVPVERLITGFYENALHEGEIIAEILVPVPEAGTRSTYVKYISRSSEDRPCVGVAASLRTTGGTVADIRVVVGAVAGTPQIFPDVLAAATAQAATPSTWKAVAAGYAELVEPLDDARGSAWYRTRLIDVMIRRALAEAAEKSSR